MKFKRILSSVLATVMATSVLSVGMVVSASAATTQSTVVSTSVQYPETAVTVPGEYPLNSKTMPVFQTPEVKDYVNASDSSTGPLKYYSIQGSAPKDTAKINPYVKANNTTWISFKVDATDCWLTVMMHSTNDKTATLFDSDGKPVKASGGTTEDGVGDITGIKNVKYHLTSAGNYYISGEDQSSAVLEEIEFSKDEPTANVISAKAKADSTSGSANIAIVKDKVENADKYYAVVLFSEGDISSLDHFTIQSTDTTSQIAPGGNTQIKTIYKDVKFDPSKEAFYDANYFGSGDYLYAFEIAGDAVTGDDGDTIKTKITYGTK